MSGEGDAERLVVLLEARIRDFEKNMQKASGTAGTSYNRMRTGSRSATRQMEADMTRSTARINHALAATSARMGTFARVGLGGLTAGFVAAVAPIMSVTAALNTAKRALDDFGKLDDKAIMLGIDVERLQEFHYAATQAGMAADNFDMGLRRMTRRAAEAAQGTGAAKDAFAELGIELTDQDGRLKSNEVLLREVADAMESVEDQGDKLRLAFKLFDTDGAKMLAVLDGGSARLDEFARKAQDLGLVVDRELIAKAAQLGDELDTATQIMDANFKQALIDLAPVLVASARLAADLAGAIRRIVDAFRDLEAKSSAALDERMRDLGRERVEIENEILRIQGEQRRMGNTNAMIFEAEIAEARRRLEAIAAEERKVLDILEGRRPVSAPPVLDYEDDEGTGSDTSGGGRNAAAEAALRQAEAVKTLIANLEHERALIGLSAVEQQKLTALRQAGAAASVEQRERIEELVQAISDEMAAAQIVADNRGPFDVMAEQIEHLDGLLQRGALSWEQYGQAVMRTRAAAVSDVLGMAGQITGAMEGMFKENKAIALANAGVYVAEGIARALTLPPPMNWMQAAAVAASGAAQISAIMSAQKGSASTPSVGASGGVAQAAMPAPQAQRVINVTFQGRGDIPRDQALELLHAIEREVGDGASTIFRVKSS